MFHEKLKPKTLQVTAVYCKLRLSLAVVLCLSIIAGG
jgi:hypothetical protein